MYAPYGYNGVDDGFIQALAWRVANGQVPYLDFVYVRPPGSVLLHALPLLVLPPELYAISERVGFFVAASASAFLAAATLTRTFDVRGWNLPRHALPLLFFVASVQDFPPMAWHTVDGVLASALAAFFVCCTRGTPGLLLGALFALFAAACKQPFLAVPVGALLVVGWVRGRRAAVTFAGGLVGISLLGLALLAAFGMLGEAWLQSTAQTRLPSLFHAGFVSYARGAAYLALPLGAWFLAAGAFRWLGGLVVPRAWLAPAVVLWVFGADIVRSLATERFQTPAFNYPGGLFCVAALTLAVVAWRRRHEPDRRGPAALALLLLVAWCASVSWGYPTPVLFSGPIWFGVLVGASTWLQAAPRRLVALALPLALIAQFAGYRQPYREAPRGALTEPLGPVFPVLSHVYSSVDNRRRLEELRSLAGRYPRFTVLPGLPGAHLLTGTIPPIGIDWARNGETGGRTGGLIDQLESSRAHVFLERAAEPTCKDGPGCSTLAHHVASTWQVVEEREHFRVYRPSHERLETPAAEPF